MPSAISTPFGTIARDDRARTEAQRRDRATPRAPRPRRRDRADARRRTSVLWQDARLRGLQHDRIAEARRRRDGAASFVDDAVRDDGARRTRRGARGLGSRRAGRPRDAAPAGGAARRRACATGGSGSPAARGSRDGRARRRPRRARCGAVEHGHARLGEAHRDRVVAQLRVVGEEGHGLVGRCAAATASPRRSRRSGSSRRGCRRQRRPARRWSSASSARKQCSKPAAKSMPVPHASSGLLGRRPGSRRCARRLCRERREGDAGALREVDEHLAFAAGIVDGDERPGTGAAAGGEEQQRARQLIVSVSTRTTP